MWLIFAVHKVYRSVAAETFWINKNPVNGCCANKLCALTLGFPRFYLDGFGNVLYLMNEQQCQARNSKWMTDNSDSIYLSSSIPIDFWHCQLPHSWKRGIWRRFCCRRDVFDCVDNRVEFPNLEGNRERGRSFPFSESLHYTWSLTVSD